jgi:hypothetical protein
LSKNNEFLSSITEAIKFDIDDTQSTSLSESGSSLSMDMRQNARRLFEMKTELIANCYQKGIETTILERMSFLQEKKTKLLVTTEYYDVNSRKLHKLYSDCISNNVPSHILRKLELPFTDVIEQISPHHSVMPNVRRQTKSKPGSFQVKCPFHPSCQQQWNFLPCMRNILVNEGGGLNWDKYVTVSRSYKDFKVVANELKKKRTSIRKHFKDYHRDKSVPNFATKYKHSVAVEDRIVLK